MANEPIAPTRAETLQALLESLPHKYPAAVLSGEQAGRLRLGTSAQYRLELIVDKKTLDAMRNSYGEPERMVAEGRCRITVDDLEIRLLVAGEAQVGERLRLPVDALAETAEVAGGQRTLSEEGLFAISMARLLDQPDTKAAEQDRTELHRLLGARWSELSYERLTLLLQCSEREPAELRALLSETFQLLGEVDDLDPPGEVRLRQAGKQAIATFDQTVASGAGRRLVDALQAKRQRESERSSAERRRQRAAYYARNRPVERDPLTDLPPDRHRDRGPELSR